MLLPIIFIAALLLALTGALLETSISAARTALSATIARDSDSTITYGVADFTAGLAAYVARNGTTGPWPLSTSRSAAKALCGGPAPACSLTYIVSATITAASHAPATADGVAGDGDAATLGDNDTARNLQAVGINEQRLSARVSTTISNPSGTLLGSRTRFLTYRILATAPYAIITGSRDGATVNGIQSAAQGDSGGEAAGSAESAADDPSGGGQPDVGESGPPVDASVTDTRVHVRLACATVITHVVPFRNDQQIAGNDGLPWGVAPNAAYEVPCQSPSVPADAFRSEHWSNGDSNASGWTP